MIPDMLSHGAEAWGFCGELWTASRVAAIVNWQFGVHYHKDHVTRLLKRLGWSPQMPLQRAIQRDEQAITVWRTQVWPQLKKRRGSRLDRLSWPTNRVST
jgi:transposase